MLDKLYKQMSALENLKLAWARLKTAQNIQYKNYYRNLFQAYALSESENLIRLSERLNGGSYHPSSKSLRFYLAKNSGLHRPITFLHLDDLIVYQAIANIVALKFSLQRQHIEGKNVFSNLLNEKIKTNIFFFKKWQVGYKKYLKKIEQYYTHQNVWVASFDLAAYYDTIDHSRLAEIICKNSSDSLKKLITDILSAWSTDRASKIHHGIPQGPLASNILGEIYILDVDRILQKKRVKYIRYVDDIKIFGKSREEVLQNVIFMEREFKERGLVPHSHKYDLRRAHDLESAIGKNPSIQHDEKELLLTKPEETYRIFVEAFNEDHFNTTKVKYILKTSGINPHLYRFVIKKIHDYPDLSEYFCDFFMNYRNRCKVASDIYDQAIKRPIIYSYAEGKYWECLSYFDIEDSLKNEMMYLAIKRLKAASNKNDLRYGLYKFICSSNNKLILKWLPYEKSSLLQAMAIPFIPDNCINSVNYIEFANKMLKRSDYEPGLVSISKLIYQTDLSCLADLSIAEDPTGVFKNLIGMPEKIDSIGQILKQTYKLTYYKYWQNFLAKEYKHANKTIFLAKNSYHIDRNSWLNYTDSFNDILLRKFIELLTLKFPKKIWPTLVNKGKLKDYGLLLNEKSISHHKKILNGFKVTHEKRINIILSHPYDKKTQKQTGIVRRADQRKLSRLLKISYEELIKELEGIL